MFKKQAVLVAGFDYEFTGVDFAAMAGRRLTQLDRRSSKDQLKFTLFDVKAGTVRINELGASGRRSWTDATKLDTSVTPPTTVPLRFTGVSAANYATTTTGEENHFTKNPAGVMSITDVYEYVQAIGAGRDKGTLVELDFFSHGWMGGPVLVNSFQANPHDPARDPDDKDPRLFKDFTAPTMDAAKLTNFGAAFDPAGVIWTWGCSFAKDYLEILTEFRRKKPKDTPLRKLKDSDTFSLEFVEDLGVKGGKAIFDAVMQDLPGGAPPSSPKPGKPVKPRSYTVTKSLADLKTIFKHDMKNYTYSSLIAHAAGVETIGALMGTYADYERGGNGLMLIPRSVATFKTDFTGILNFYKVILGVAFDPEDRGYGIYPP